MTAALLSVALALVLVGCRTSGISPPPHILLISADALRADHLSLEGYPRRTSPHLDAFARSAWHFTQAVSVLPKTGPAMTTIFSGLYPNTHKVEANRYAIPDDVPLLAEMLHAHGYRTAAFVSNPVLSAEKGYGRGFDVFESIDGVSSANRAFTRWAEAKWTQPTFVWIHYIDPHGPYDPPERFANLFHGDSLARDDRRRVALEYEPIPGFSPQYALGAVPGYQRLGDEDRVAHYVGRYDGEIAFVDDAFSEIVELLRRDGRYDRTAVIFTSDHGESLGEHQYY
ncbi:MAG: sulfatase, partial [Candidatus Binatia bacterium]